MPRRVAPLTDLKVRSAKKREKAYKLADGGGLYLEVTPAGAKLWRLKYRQLNGKENKLHFGAYPDVSLAAARERRDAARTLLGAGIDPGQARDAEAQKARAVSENTFEKIAREWHGKMIKSWQPQTAENILHRFALDLFPVFGGVPIAEVKAVGVSQEDGNLLKAAMIGALPYGSRSQAGSVYMYLATDASRIALQVPTSAVQ